MPRTQQERAALICACLEDLNELARAAGITRRETASFILAFASGVLNGDGMNLEEQITMLKKAMGAP